MKSDQHFFLHECLNQTEADSIISVSDILWCGCYGIRREARWLYIGHSEVGWCRVLNKGHHVIGKKFTLEKDDKIHRWFCSPEVLLQREDVLLATYEPAFNDPATISQAQSRIRDRVELVKRRAMHTAFVKQQAGKQCKQA